MKFSRIFAETALHSRLARIAIHLAAILMFPKRWRFYLAGIRREFQRRPISTLGRLLAASHDHRRIGRPRL